jgi:hypothetical protein
MFLPIFDKFFLVILRNYSYFCSLNLIVFYLVSILQVKLLIPSDLVLNFLPLSVCQFGELVGPGDILFFVLEFPPQLLFISIFLINSRNVFVFNIEVTKLLCGLLAKGLHCSRL